MNLLKDNMLHKKVINIEQGKDCLSLLLNDGSTITLFNGISSSAVQSLVGKTITDVELNEEVLKILLNKTEKIEMGMRSADYIGPEAFLYHGSNGVLISG